MDILGFYSGYSLQIGLAYAFFIACLAMIVSLKAKKLHYLSSHRGIKLFSLAFFFFSLSFFIQFLMLSLGLLGYQVSYLFDIAYSIAFFYPISLSGFYLVYSLVWKHSEETSRRSKLMINLVFHAVALAISVLEVTYSRGWLSFLFLTQICVSSYGIFISYGNYQRSRHDKKHSFLQLYFIAFVLMFLGWVFNYISSVMQSNTLDLYSMLITLIILMIFVYGVFSVTNRK